MRTDTGTPIRLEDYRPPAYVVTHIDLAFDLDPVATLVTARSTFVRASEGPAELVLDGVGFELVSIAVDGAPLAADAYVRTDDTLTLPHPPAAFTLEVVTRLNPAANTALEGLYVSNGRFCTQCEAEGFRKITYAQDRPDSLSRFTVRLTADKASYPLLLSNGDPVEAGDLPGGRHFAVWRDPHPKPSYLFALVAGAFDSQEDVFVTRSGRRVRLGVHVDHGDGSRTAYAMDALKRAMAWDERVYGREYDLDVYNIVAVRDFNFGAMENKGLNIFNSMYILADPDTATDLDFEGIEAVVAHEYFHNWTGNRITCRDWFQLSLKEGLTVFREQEFCADERSRPVQRIKDVKRLRARQFPEDAGPLAHPVRPRSYMKIDNFYTATVYEKGAEVIRVLKRIIGDVAFYRGLEIYFDTFDGQAVTIEDILGCFAQASGQTLDGVLTWYGQAGTPRLRARGAFDPASGVYTLTLRQTHPPTPGQPEKRPLPIPLAIGFLGADGAPLALSRDGGPALAEHHHVLTEAEATFTFRGAAAAPIPAVLRGFSAPVLLDDDLTEDQRRVQMAHDPDPFTRWEAGQTLARTLLLRDADTPGTAFGGLVEGLGQALARAEEDPAFTALALRLPDLGELIQAAERPDPDALDAARRRLRAAAAQALEGPLTARAHAPAERPFSPSAAAAGRRALKSAALDLLAGLGLPATERLTAAFNAAASMTEEISALEALGACGADSFEDALDRFHARWRDQPLVLDKWFAAQAAAPRPDALARVTRLRSHPDYNLRNPNRVRALAMAFPARNPRAFHAADGGGYRFVADIVAEVDPINPALAARLMTSFESWRRFDAPRQAAARATIERLAALPGLSTNTAEMVARMLA